jgi:hypothetical protein
VNALAGTSAEGAAEAYFARRRRRAARATAAADASSAPNDDASPWATEHIDEEPVAGAGEGDGEGEGEGEGEGAGPAASHHTSVHTDAPAVWQRLVSVVAAKRCAQPSGVWKLEPHASQCCPGPCWISTVHCSW